MVTDLGFRSYMEDSDAYPRDWNSVEKAAHSCQVVLAAVFCASAHHDFLGAQRFFRGRQGEGGFTFKVGYKRQRISTSRVLELLQVARLLV